MPSGLPSDSAKQRWSSIRKRPRKDGSLCYSVLYWIDGQQRTLPFDVEASAELFKQAVKVHGAERALAMYGIDPAPRRRDSKAAGMTIAEWVKHHIDHLTGVDARTVEDYEGYLRKDIGPSLGAVPLAQLSRDDVSLWIQGLEQGGAAAKTIANKHGFLSTALASAVAAGHIPANTAARTRLPRDEKLEMVFLSHTEFRVLLAEVPEPW
ncbi:hypothetical protein [Mycobacterium haemophilum]|uniref:hypothetical protein n=1 Tax=Mycobacterium haemophilum TaxID=29311 RepID=UPI000ACDC632|nr:hypothetical protein [Mycobacterium haemophilum]